MSNLGCWQCPPAKTPGDTMHALQFRKRMSEQTERTRAWGRWFGKDLGKWGFPLDTSCPGWWWLYDSLCREDRLSEATVLTGKAAASTQISWERRGLVHLRSGPSSCFVWAPTCWQTGRVWHRRLLKLCMSSGRENPGWEWQTGSCCQGMLFSFSLSVP